MFKIPLGRPTRDFVTPCLSVSLDLRRCRNAEGTIDYGGFKLNQEQVKIEDDGRVIDPFQLYPQPPWTAENKNVPGICPQAACG